MMQVTNKDNAKYVFWDGDIVPIHDKTEDMTLIRTNGVNLWVPDKQVPIFLKLKNK